MEIFDFSQKTTKELEERLDYLFNVAVEQNKERIKAARTLENCFETEEYDLAKQEQASIHIEISEIREELYRRTIKKEN